MDKIGDRFKNYERAYKIVLPPLMPLIIRVDGKAFHTFTKHFIKPFDFDFIGQMSSTMVYLVNNIQGCRYGYCQSDEISLLLLYYDNMDSEPFFANELQKIVSITASMATAKLNSMRSDGSMGMFDARIFPVPEFDVPNYFIWRQRDWQKNSIQMLARSVFSHKELNGKNGTDMQAMLLEQGIDYSEQPDIIKYGSHFKRGWDTSLAAREYTRNRNIFDIIMHNFTKE